VLEDGGLSFHAPMSLEAIPMPLLQATDAGRVVLEILDEVGYDAPESLAELRKSMEKPQYVPLQVQGLLKRLAKKQRRDVAAIGQAMLAERNWNVPMTPVADLVERENRFGFRHLIVGRTRVVADAALFGPPGAQAAAPQPPASPAALPPPERPFSVRLLATGNPVDPSDLPTGAMDEGMRARVAAFATNVLAWHPCLPALSAAKAVPAASTTPASPGPPEARTFPEWIDADEGRRALLDKLLDAYSRTALAARDDRAARLGLLAIHFRTAREAARLRRFPTALVIYRDLVDHLDAAPPLASPGAAAGGQEPSAEEIARFVSDLRVRGEDALLAVIAEAEQGAVLRAAGRDAAARWVWRRSIERHRFCTLPALDRAVALASRLREEQLPAEITDLRARITATVEQLEFETRAEGTAPDQITPVAASSAATGLAAWLAEKAAARVDGGLGLWRGTTLIAPFQLAPASFTDDKGLHVDLGLLVPDPPTEPPHLARDFLLGWQRLETGDEPGARDAFGAAAREYFAAAGGDPAAALVARRNGLMLLLAAASAADPPDGVPPPGIGCLDALVAEAKAWERDWSKSGLPGGIATREVARFEAFAALLRAAALRRRGGIGDRYFPADYTFAHGPLPDPLVDDAVEWKVFETVPREPDSRPKPEPPPAEQKPPAPPAATAPQPPAPPAPSTPPPPPPPPPPGSEPKPLEFSEFLQAAYKIPRAADPQVMALR
jgi:hypothetical protein